jgi:hypothetical protein
MVSIGKYYNFKMERYSLREKGEKLKDTDWKRHLGKYFRQLRGNLEEYVIKFHVNEKNPNIHLNFMIGNRYVNRALLS